jgi:hypothetical protein
LAQVVHVEDVYEILCAHEVSGPDALDMALDMFSQLPNLTPMCR